MRTRLRFVVLAALFTLHCAGVTPLARAQQSHDFLALAQDDEATLCYGMALTAAMGNAVIAAAPNHCVTDAAKTVGLTDVRHQDFNKALTAAFNLQKAYTTQLASGAQADVTPLQQAIDAVLAIVAQLVPQSNPSVTATALHLNQARIK